MLAPTAALVLFRGGIRWQQDISPFCRGQWCISSIAAGAPATVAFKKSLHTRLLSGGHILGYDVSLFRNNMLLSTAQLGKHKLCFWEDFSIHCKVNLPGKSL